MVVVADFMVEGSGIYPCWTGDRVLGVCAALCVCRKANVVENACFWRLQQRHTNRAKSEKSTIKKDKTRKR